MLLLFTPDVQDTRVAWLLFLPFFWSATALCFLVRMWCLRAVMPEWEKLKLHLHHLKCANILLLSVSLKNAQNIQRNPKS